MCNYFNKNDIQIWIAICSVHMAESLLTGLVFSRPYLLFIVDVGHNFVSGICNLKPKKILKT